MRMQPGSTKESSMDQQLPRRTQTTALGWRLPLARAIIVPTGVALLVAICVWYFPDLNFLPVSDQVFVGTCLAVSIAGLVTYFIVWRCPECKSYLGKESCPGHCPHCGVRFTETNEGG
jgi:hypothetical protein